MRPLLVLLALGCGTKPVEPRSAPAAGARAAPQTAAAPSATTAAAPAAPAAAPPACHPAAPAAPAADLAGSRGLFAPKRRASSPDMCGVADANVARAEAAILALAPPPPAAPPAAWDRRSPPARLPLIERRFGLSAAERRQLARDGFVVPERLAQPSWGWAFHEIYQSQLPIYVSADAILHAVYAAHDRLVARLERTELAPRLAALLSALHCALPAAAPRLPPDTARDLDLYLSVARGLLQGVEVPSALGDAAVAREARALAAKARAAGPREALELFGRARVIDFSQYRPRGHYEGALAPYFRAAMWLSRLEWNIASRSSRSSAPGPAPDPAETPREVIGALALAELVEAAGQRAELDRIEQVFALLAGRREDIPLPKLAELARGAGIADLRAPDAAARLRAAVGDGFQRTARIHYMPEGAAVLPAIATLLGPRITADAAALRPLAHAEVPGRHRIRGGDLAYILGHDRGRAHLAADLAAFPGLPAALREARRIVEAAPRGDDLYSAWLGAILGLARRPAGAVPSYMATDAFADLRVSSAIAAFAQLRHNHVLIAGQAYAEGGCEIPDGYVEPAPAVYDALAAYADLGARRVALLEAGGPGAAATGGAASARAYFERLGRIARVLSAISRLELANQPLPAEALRWLSMVVEINPAGSDGRPTYTGWYFDLFQDRSDGIAAPDLVADVFTSDAGVSYAGAAAPRLGVFVVDTGGAPRAVIGPVAHGYEHQQPGPRLTDETARALPARARAAPWAARYTVAAPPAPAFEATLEAEMSGETSIPVMDIHALHPIPSLTIQLLDHHRVPLAQVTRAIPRGKTRVRLPAVREEEHVKTYGFIAGDFRATAEPCGCCDCEPMTFGAYPRRAEPAEPAEPDESADPAEP